MELLQSLLLELWHSMLSEQNLYLSILSRSDISRRAEIYFEKCYDFFIIVFHVFLRRQSEHQSSKPVQKLKKFVPKSIASERSSCTFSLMTRRVHKSDRKRTVTVFHQQSVRQDANDVVTCLLAALTVCSRSSHRLFLSTSSVAWNETWVIDYGTVIPMIFD